MEKLFLNKNTVIKYDFDWGFVNTIIYAVCEASWTRFGFQCFKEFVVGTSINKTESKELCYEHNSQLVTIQSQAEEDFLTDFMPGKFFIAAKMVNLWNLNQLMCSIPIHVKDNSNLIWEKDVPVNFTNWNLLEGQPDQPHVECVWKKILGWHDVLCSSKTTFVICSKDV